MLIDSINMLSGGAIENATIGSGSTLPVQNVTGQIFFKTGSNAGLYYNDGSTWQLAISALASDTNFVNTTGDSMAGPLSLAGAPTLDSHAATKAYVDSAVTGIASGLDFKTSVKAATTSNITLSTQQTVDGVSLVAGDRVLVKNQTTAADNGIYIVASGSWSRASDFDGNPNGEVTTGAYTYVEGGTINAGSGYVLTTNDPITVGSTSLSFTKINTTAVPTIPYDIATYCSGKPTASEKVLALKAATSFNFVANLVGSVASASTAATASTVFSVRKNGTQFNTITFAAAGTSGTFASSSAQTFAVGDVLEIIAPASADATLADIMFTLKGTA